MKKILIPAVLILFFYNFLVFSAEQGDVYYALYINGKRCGYEIQSRRIEDEKIINTDKMLIELKRLGSSVTMDVQETCIESIDGKPLGFKILRKIASMDMVTEGSIDPDGNMKIRVTNAGSTNELNELYPAGAVMPEGLSRIFKQHGLKEGTGYSVETFSPSSLDAMKVIFHVGPEKPVDLLGRVIDLIEIKGDCFLKEQGQVSFIYYVDKDYNFQKLIMPVAGMSLESIACSREFALSKLEAFEMVESMTVKSPKVISQPGKYKKILYTLKPFKGKSLTIPDTDNQKVRIMNNGSIKIAVEPIKGSLKSEYPYKGSDTEMLKALKSTQYLQTYHPDIIALAQKAVKGKNNALDAAHAIETFVSVYIEDKNFSVGYASALEVSKSRQGDCTEHAVLTAAMCRAAGIPARVVMGIVYYGEHRFIGHAWAEVCIGNKWIGLDAALINQRKSFDATHIAMAVGNGDAGDFFGITSNIGNFTLTDIRTFK